MSEPKVAQKGPYSMIIKPGTYYWCACGRSAKQPFCDGAHKVTEFIPIRVDITEEKQVWWCGCKQTTNKPFCDGSHNKLL
jgi:CDGSH-type Zn-finger protein